MWIETFFNLLGEIAPRIVFASRITDVREANGFAVLVLSGSPFGNTQPTWEAYDVFARRFESLSSTSPVVRASDDDKAAAYAAKG